MTASEPNPNLALVSTNRGGENRLLSLLPIDERQRLLSRMILTFSKAQGGQLERGPITVVHFEGEVIRDSNGSAIASHLPHGGVRRRRKLVEAGHQ